MTSFSLRTRLLAAIFAALLISFTLSTALAALQAARSVHEELAAALVSARQGTQAALADLPPGAAGEAALRRIVAAFDGNRHVRAVLLGPGQGVLASSQTVPGREPPAWFLRVVAPPLKSVVAPVAGVPGVSGLRLSADPVLEAGERWAEFRLRFASFAIFFVVAAGLCSLTAARSLRPLTLLAQALARVGRREAPPAMPEAGPPEIAALARAFNTMAADLQAADARNRQLSRQIMTIAEEERADIARDLHDEIGPLLFAITAFAAAIGRQVEQGEVAQVPAQVQAIQDATGRLQHQVRAMLAQLHDSEAPPEDLAEALGALADFWRSVRPETRLDVDAPPGLPALPAAARVCLFRAAQEAVNNAVRHGQARHIQLSLRLIGGQAELTIRDDGKGGVECPQGGLGMGLPGMRARAAALGGQVTVARGQGWVVAVTVPIETAVPVQAA